MDRVRACFIDRCWTDVITTNNGVCQPGSTQVQIKNSGVLERDGSEVGALSAGGAAACCGPWGTTSHVAEWQDLDCSLAASHAASNWVTIAKFGPHGLNSFDALEAAGWILHATDDYQVCGINGECEGWCPDEYGCTGEDEYASFWCPGGCTGAIELPLPTEFNRGRLTLGMHYDNPACHGSVTVGGVSVFANDGTSSTTTIEFDYSPGQTLVISEQDTCTVEVHRLEAVAANWVMVSKFGPSDINSLESLQSSGWSWGAEEHITSFQVCGLSGCTAGWCGNPCSMDADYAGFWCGGSCTGTMEFTLPTGYNKGRLHVGMSYNNQACHGLITVGGEVIYDEMFMQADKYSKSATPLRLFSEASKEPFRSRV